jgi:hypothetical protein
MQARRLTGMIAGVADTEVVLRSRCPAVQQRLAFGDTVNIVPSEELITDVVLAVLPKASL